MYVYIYVYIPKILTQAAARLRSGLKALVRGDFP